MCSLSHAHVLCSCMIAECFSVRRLILQHSVLKCCMSAMLRNVLNATFHHCRCCPHQCKGNTKFVHVFKERPTTGSSSFFIRDLSTSIIGRMVCRYCKYNISVSRFADHYLVVL